MAADSLSHFATCLLVTADVQKKTSLTINNKAAATTAQTYQRFNANLMRSTIFGFWESETTIIYEALGFLPIGLVISPVLNSATTATQSNGTVTHIFVKPPTN